ncbi:MAG: HupE/UreJ family protein, partial [Planctomycetota bacterium]
LAALPCRPAAAHLVSTELGPFYDGAAHPLVTPADLLTILALAVLAAYGGAAAGRRLLVSLCAGWIAGLAAAFAVAGAEWQVPLVTASAILGLGVIGLLYRRVPAALLAVAAAAIGLGRGLLNGSAARAADGQWLSVIGIATGVFVLAALLAALCLVLERRRATILLRVGSSWIAAIGLLMLGWEIRSMVATAP